MSNELLFFIQFFFSLFFLGATVKFSEAALVAFIALQAVLANLFIMKQIVLFGFTLTCSDLFFVGSMLGLSLLQEYFGKEAARRAGKISFLALLFFTLAAQITLWYQPAPEDLAQGAFKVIFSTTARIVFSSLAVYYLVQKLEILLFGFLRALFSGRFFALRVALSLLITQTIDTLLFSFSALYGVITPLFDVMVVSLCVKCLVIGGGASFASFSRKFLENKKAAA